MSFGLRMGHQQASTQGLSAVNVIGYTLCCTLTESREGESSGRPPPRWAKLAPVASEFFAPFVPLPSLPSRLLRIALDSQACTCNGIHA